MRCLSICNVEKSEKSESPRAPKGLNHCLNTVAFDLRARANPRSVAIKRSSMPKCFPPISTVRGYLDAWRDSRLLTTINHLPARERSSPVGD
jgi:hypothetical protein